MDEWTRYQEASYGFWKTLENASWWTFLTTEGVHIYVLARALPDPERFSIVLTDLTLVWTCEGNAATVQTLHADFNRGLETDTRGMVLHIDKLIANFDPNATYEFTHSVWKAKTLLANVYRFQCQFMCIELPQPLARCLLNKYLLGALFTIIKTQEAIIDRQLAMIRSMDNGKNRVDIDGDIRRLAQDAAQQPVALGRQARTVLSEVLEADIAVVHERAKARENELKRKRLEDLQRQIEQAKKPKSAAAKPVALYEETAEEFVRRKELADKLQKQEGKKKPKRMDFL